MHLYYQDAVKCEQRSTRPMIHVALPKAKRKNYSSCLAEAKSLQREIEKQAYTAHFKYAMDIVALVTKELERFWAYVKHQRKTLVSPRFLHNKKPVTLPTEIAELSSSHFISIWSHCSTPLTTPMPAENALTAPPSTSTVFFSPHHHSRR